MRLVYRNENKSPKIDNFLFNLFYLSFPLLSLFINGNIGILFDNIQNVSTETSCIFLFNYVVSFPFFIIFLILIKKINPLTSFETNFLDFISKTTIPFLVFIIIYKFLILIEAVNNYNADMLRQLVFPSSEGESLFFKNQTIYFLYNCVSNFSFILSLVVFFYDKKSKWLLLVLVILDKATNLERGFYISLFYCLIFIIFNFTNKERKSRSFKAVLIVFSLALIQFFYVSMIRSINDSPLSNLGKNLLISPRLFDYFIDHRSMDGFYLYGYNSLSGPIYPLVKKIAPITSGSVENSKFTKFHDDFHPIVIFKNDINYENAYVTGVFASYRDFGILGIIFQWVIFFIFSVFFLAIMKTKSIAKTFLLISLSQFSITFIFGNYITFNLFYSSIYIVLGLLIVYLFMIKIKGQIFKSSGLNNYYGKTS